MADKNEKNSSVLDPKDGFEANFKKVFLGVPVILAADAVNNSDFVKSGKAAMAGESIVQAVKDLPQNIGYGIGYAEAKANEALGTGVLNNLALKACSAMQDIPVLGTLQAPGCQAIKDVVAARGVKK